MSDIYFVANVVSTTEFGLFSFTYAEIDKLCLEMATSEPPKEIPVLYQHEGPVVGKILHLFRTTQSDSANDMLSVIGIIKGDTKAAEVLLNYDVQSQPSIRPLVSTRMQLDPENAFPHLKSAAKRINNLALLDEAPDPQTKEGQILCFSTIPELLQHYVRESYWQRKLIRYIHPTTLEWLGLPPN